MTIDTLAYAKHLEQAGVERPQAEAFAEAIHRFVLPDLVTKADLTTAKLELAGLIHTVEIRLIGTIAAMLGLSIAIIKWV